MGPNLSKFEAHLIIFCDNSFQVEVLQIVLKEKCPKFDWIKNDKNHLTGCVNKLTF